MVLGRKHTGGVIPFGYTVNSRGNFKRNTAEQKIIRFAAKLRRKGNTFRDISETLNFEFDEAFTPDQIRQKLFRYVEV